MPLDIVRRRLQAQRLIGPRFATPAEAVAWFGAVQAQDYRGALWAVAQRCGVTEVDVEQALVDRTIIRTWPMRGTLHFVASDDARWMLGVLAPRIIKRAAGRYRELGLDARAFGKSSELLRTALAGGQQLDRTEVYDVLERGGVSPAGQRGIHVIGQLAMQRMLCFGAPRGKQQTFALLDDWLPTSRVLDGDEALAELARRYFTSHGPATVQDFAWWTGLTLTEARHGTELAKPHLAASVVGGATYLEAATRARTAKATTTAHLLPPYDEYTVAYKDRSAFLDAANAERSRNGIFTPVVLIDGRIAGLWRRAIAKGRVTITVELFTRPTRASRALLEAEVARYGEFVGLPAKLSCARSPT